MFLSEEMLRTIWAYLTAKAANDPSAAAILQKLDATSRCLPMAKPAGEAMKVRPKRRGCGNRDCPHCSGSLECGMCKRSGQIVDYTFVEELRFISRHLRLRTLPNVQWQLRQASNILPF
jgi:hypothetical protein